MSLDPATGAAQGRWCLRGLDLVDGTRGARGQGTAQGMAILIDGDRIAAIAPAADADFGDATVVDASGLVAIPGLIDAHVHLATLPDARYAQAQMARMLAGGITAVRDMAGDMRALAELARASQVHEIAGPDLFYAALMAGPDFFADPRPQMAARGAVAGAVPWAQAIDDATDLPLAVAQARGTWATGIKLYACIEGATVRRVITEARRQGIPVWTHLKIYPAVPIDAIGATSVSHSCMLADHALDPAIPDYWTSRKVHLDYASLSLDDPEVSGFIAAMAEAGTIVDPTLLVEQIVESHQRAAAVEAGRPHAPSGRLEVAGRLTRAMHEAGVPIAAGTDFPSAPEDPYPSLVQELELLVRHAGFTPAEALHSATYVSARTIAREAEMGTLEPGKLANIVLLEANPLEDIGNLRRVRNVVKRGVHHARADYRHDREALTPRHG